MKEVLLVISIGLNILLGAVCADLIGQQHKYSREVELYLYDQLQDAQQTINQLTQESTEHARD